MLVETIIIIVELLIRVLPPWVLHRDEEVMEWRSALIVHEPRGRRKGGGRGGAAGDAHEVHELRELRVGLRVAREPLVVLHVDVPADWQPRRVGGSGCRSLVVMRSCVLRG